MITKDEAREVIQELLEKDTPEEVSGIFVRMYVDGKISFSDLEFMMDECGMEITDEFRNMSFEEQKRLVEAVLNGKVTPDAGAYEFDEDDDDEFDENIDINDFLEDEDLEENEKRSNS